jgi:hypothetical protein
MDCRDCARLETETGKCRDAKLNPEHWEQAVAVSQVFGLRAICVFNDYRERLIQARAVGGPTAGRRIPSTFPRPRHLR